MTAIYLLYITLMYEDQIECFLIVCTTKNKQFFKMDVSNIQK